MKQENKLSKKGEKIMEKRKPNLIFHARYASKDGKKNYMYEFDASENPEKAIASALFTGVQTAWDDVSVGDWTLPLYNNQMWAIKNNQVVETDLPRDLTIGSLIDFQTMKQYYNDITAGKITWMETPDINEFVNKTTDKPGTPYKFYTDDNPDYQRGTIILEYNYELTKNIVDALDKKDAIPADLKEYYNNSALKPDNHELYESSFTSQMIHLLPEELQPKNIQVDSHDPYNIKAQCQIGNDIINRTYHMDPKSISNFGTPPDAEVTGYMLNNYIADRLLHLYDKEINGFDIKQNKKGKDYVFTEIEMNGVQTPVHFSRTYGNYTLFAEDIVKLKKGEEISIPSRSGQAKVKLGENTYMGHKYIGLTRTDLPTKQTPDIKEPDIDGIEKE